MDISQTDTLKHYRGTKSFIVRFIASRTMRSSVFIGLTFGAYLGSKAAGFASAYPTVQAPLALSASFSSNVGLEALLGAPHDISTVTGFAVWNTLGIMAIVGAIWATVVATKTFRGEEDAGRREVLLAGQTTPAKAAADTLVGLLLTLVVLYGVVAVTFIAVGRINTVNFAVGPALFFALSATVSAAVFMALGALLSQLMPTRARAAGVATAIFGISFMIRAAADSTNVGWLRNLSPLGWVEQLQPLHDSQPLWLVPLLSTAAILSLLTLFFARNRDLGASVFTSKDTSRPHTRLLSSAFTAAIRLTWAMNIAWLAAVAAGTLLFGFLAKPAAQALNDSVGIAHALDKIAGTSASSGAITFLGLAFFLLMTLIMCYIASSCSKMREEEAEGYLDNLFVQPLGRTSWLIGRICIIAAGLLCAGLLLVLCTWLGITGQNLGVSLSTLVSAALNALAPSFFILGAGIFSFGVLPRLTSLITYGIIGWSFLIETLSSGLKLDEWVLNMSVFHHITLAPAVIPDWHADSIIAAIAIILCLIGIWRFAKRDLQSA